MLDERAEALVETVVEKTENTGDVKKELKEAFDDQAEKIEVATDEENKKKSLEKQVKINPLKNLADLCCLNANIITNIYPAVWP